MQTFRLVKYLTSAAVVLTLLTPAPAAAAAPPVAAAHDAVAAASGTEAAPPAAEDWQPPLSTRGRYIVDAQGRRFRLKSANWDGAQGSWSGSGSAADPADHHAGQNSSGIPSAWTAPRCPSCSPTSTGSASTASGCRSPTR